jgi:ATP/maltotriose-dependent transcriptional regulator MalT/DNA-binding SARP family transcriptional activator
MDFILCEQQARNKHFAPRLIPGQYLPRKGLLDGLLAQGASGKKLISLEAQAGQGKSNFAVQYLDRIGADSCWYQIGHEDLDPVGFITQIVTSVDLHFPGLSFPSLQKLIDNGEITPDEPGRFAEIFASEIEPALTCVHYLVFDDIHLLEDSPNSLRFLQLLIEAAPDRLRFILLSRRSTLSDLMPRNRIQIDNEDLSLSRNEIAELCTSILHLPTPGDRVQELYRSTEGWIMGVLLAGQSISGTVVNGTEPRLRALDGKEEVDIFNYFQQEVLSSLSADLRRTLLLLSLLETIPLSLAQNLAGNEDTLKYLHQSGHQNHFVRQLDAENSTFAFHHLFRDCLRNAAASELPLDQHREVYGKAATWYQNHGQSEKALDYYLRAEEYPTAGSLLQQLGPTLLAGNRLVTLQGVLTQLPRAILEDNAWLTFFCGVTSMDKDPTGAYRYLHEASEKFAKEGDLLGELLSATNLVYFHCLVDGRLKSGGHFLDRADSLYGQLVDKLSVSVRFQIAQVLSLGCLYIGADVISSGNYADIAKQAAEVVGHDNFIFGATLCNTYRYGFQGDWQMFRKAIDRLMALYVSPLVSGQNKMTFRLIYLNFLAMEGDFESYHYLKDVLLKGDVKGIAEKTIFAPFLLVWDIDTYIATGRLDEAGKLIKDGLELGGIASGPHMRSQYLHYQAYLFALQGEKEEALAAARESRQLRMAAGGGYFVALNSMILGAVYAQLQLPELAEPLLQSAIDFSTETGNDFNRAAAHGHRAHLRLATGDQAGALADIRQMLRCLQEKAYVHFFTWTPRIVADLLRVAVDHGIEVDFARALYGERLGQALLADGRSVPLLKIKSLGGLLLEIDGVARVASHQLTPGQRDILAMLIAAPEGGLLTGEVQLALWTDSPEKKARSKFDNLLSRLRKVLEESFGSGAAKVYLKLEKGMLSLQNCSIDVTGFQRKARAGLKHQKRKEFSQAVNALRSAHNLWGGEFCPGVQAADSVIDFRHDLLNLYLQSARHLHNMLLANGQRDGALKVAENALRYDRTNEVLVRKVHSFHVQNGDLVKARRSVRRYEDALRREDYPAGEIKEILEGFWQGRDDLVAQ